MDDSGVKMHTLTPDYDLRTPPGKLGNLSMLVLSLTMVILAIRSTLRNAKPLGEGAPTAR